MENKIYLGDALKVLKTLPDESVNCVITSPPYWALRDYGIKGQLGMEETFYKYLENLLSIFDEIKRVLKKDGTCWVNMGDTYGGTSDKGSYTDPKYKNGRNGQVKSMNRSATSKSLCQIPSRFAIGMTDRGWLLRNEIIWHKPNAMPSSAKDRFNVDFEKIFFFTKSKKYYFEQQLEKSIWADRDARFINGPSSGGKAVSGEYAINKGGAFRSDGMRNRRTVWTINTKGYPDAYFATFPEALIEAPVKSGCPINGVVLDPFMGAGTTAVVAKKLKRNYLGIEINPAYIKIANKRIKDL